jgi:hypothetical protein
MLVFAQVPAVPPDPFSGWGSLLLQGGAFVLLAYMVIRLAPQLFKEMREEREARDTKFATAIDNLQNKYDERNESITQTIAATSKDANDVIRELSRTFRDEARAERLACESHFSKLAEAMTRGNESNVAAFKTLADSVASHAQRNQQWNDLLRAKHLELQAAQETAQQALKRSE